jgi:hypothetical protein
MGHFDALDETAMTPVGGARKLHGIISVDSHIAGQRRDPQRIDRHAR